MLVHARAHRPAVDEDQGKLGSGFGCCFIGVEWWGCYCGSVVLVEELSSVAWGGCVRHLGVGGGGFMGFCSLVIRCARVMVL